MKSSGGAVAGVLVASVVLAAAGGPASGVAARRYSTPVVAIPTAPGSVAPARGGGTGGEPRLLVTSDGRVLVAAHLSQWDCVTGKPSPGQGHQCVWASTDGGRSFHFSRGANQRGDDVDLAESGGVLLESTMTNVGLGTGVGGTTVARSTDRGRTWSESVAVNKDVVNDRPFLLAAPDGSVVLTYATIPGGIVLVRSTDHGLTWGLPQPVAITPSAIGGLNGAPVVDKVRRQLVVPYAIGSSPTCTSGAAGCLDTFFVARGSYDGTGFVSEPVLATPAGTGTTSLISAAADAAGTDYVSISTADGADLTHSPSKDAHITLVRQRVGETGWTASQVDPIGGSAMLPNLVAGVRGRVVVAYYWSPFADAESQDRPWYVVVADSHDSGKTFVRTTVSKVAWTGAAANHQFVLWDLFGLGLDRTGLVHVAWTAVSGNTSAGPLTHVLYAHQIAAATSASVGVRRPSRSQPLRGSLAATGGSPVLVLIGMGVLLCLGAIRRRRV